MVGGGLADGPVVAVCNGRIYAVLVLIAATHGGGRAGGRGNTQSTSSSAPSLLLPKEAEKKSR